jgi:hypothetical protein
MCIYTVYVCIIPSQKTPKDVQDLLKLYPYFTIFLCSATACVILMASLISIMLLVEPCIPPFPSYWIACGAENYYVIKNLIASFISFVSLINLMASCAAAAPYGAFLVVFALFGDLRLLKVNGRLRVHISYFVVSFNLFAFVRFHSSISLPARFPVFDSFNGRGICDSIYCEYDFWESLSFVADDSGWMGKTP